MEVQLKIYILKRTMRSLAIQNPRIISVIVQAAFAHGTKCEILANHVVYYSEFENLQNKQQYICCLSLLKLIFNLFQTQTIKQHY